MNTTTQNSTTGTPAADLLEGHEYDGVEEYDNPMPRWWVWIFWGTFYFAICYVLWFHVFMRGVPIVAEYEADMGRFRAEVAKREMGSEVTEASLQKLMTNPALMADAKELFAKRCTPCHADSGRGLIGPNLTDDYWIHGEGMLMDIFGVVNGGETAKGMPAWGKQLSRIEVAKAAAYVGTLRGKHLPGKAPEGTLLTSTAPPAK